MRTIQLLQPAGDWPAGAVVSVEDRRADRLIRTGYAREMDVPIHATQGGVTKSRKERTH